MTTAQKYDNHNIKNSTLLPVGGFIHVGHKVFLHLLKSLFSVELCFLLYPTHMLKFCSSSPYISPESLSEIWLLSGLQVILN